MIKAMIFDLDGTIYSGCEPIPGAVEFVDRLQDHGIAVRYYTNRAVLTPAQIAEEMNSMKIKVSPDQILTSAIVTAHHLHGQKVFYIGEKALGIALENEDIIFSDDNPDCVVVGFVEDLKGDALKKAVQLIHHQGAGFVATNQDPYIIVAGKRVPENGAILASIEAVTDVNPLVYGKPNPAGIHLILDKLKVKPRELIMVGDTPATDIECGIKAGVQTALIMTGIASVHEAAESRADMICSDYTALSAGIFNEY